MKRMEAPYVRTGYEGIMAVRSSDKFVISAIEDGVVESVTKKSITVIYKDSGKKVYKFNAWTTKEEAGTAYRHILVPNLKKGDKFVKDDTLVYDKSMFEPDIFYPNRVIYRSGSSLTVALIEAPETYEDSGAISYKASLDMGTVATKVKSIKINKDDNIVDPVKVGDKTTPKSPLLSIADSMVSSISGLDDRAIEVLKNLKKSTPKASYKGTVSKIRVFYNCEFEELTKSLQEIARISDSELKDETGYTGRVDSSYSIKGVPLQEGEVEIKIYIDTDVPMGLADKAIFGNQLKFTVGEVFHNKILTEDGREVDALFSTRSIKARIVNSPDLIGTTSKVLEVLSEHVVDEYFK